MPGGETGHNECEIMRIVELIYGWETDLVSGGQEFDGQDGLGDDGQDGYGFVDLLVIDISKITPLQANCGMQNLLYKHLL